MRTAAEFVPDATSGNSTHIDIAAAPSTVWRAFEEFRFDELKLTGVLMGVRSLPARLFHRGPLRSPRSAAAPTVIGAMATSRFAVLCREPEVILTLGSSASSGS